MIYANAGNETYEYNEMGEISSVTGPDGGTVQYAYDKLGNPIGIIDKEGNKKQYKIGEDGVPIHGSKTVAQNGSTEQVDVENPNPGKGNGNMHYHEPNNTKWYYVFLSKNIHI